jgi:hypothetical protein
MDIASAEARPQAPICFIGSSPMRFINCILARAAVTA